MRGIVGYQNTVRYQSIAGYQRIVGCQSHRQPSGVAPTPLLGSLIGSDA